MNRPPHAVSFFYKPWMLLFGIIVATVFATTALAADESSKKNAGGIFGALGLSDSNVSGKEDHVTFSAHIEAIKGGPTGTLTVTAKIEPEWHIYSVTQAPKGPTPTTIRLVPTAGQPATELVSQPTPVPPPVIHSVPEFPMVDVEEHELAVTWTAKVRLPMADAADIKTNVQISGLVCHDTKGCVPFRISVEAPLTGFQDDKLRGRTGPYQGTAIHAKLEGHLDHQTIAPGSSLKVAITATSAPGFHIYALKSERPKGSSEPTIILLKNLGDWIVNPSVADSEPIEHSGSPPLFYHEEPVTWTTTVEVPEIASPGDYLIAGAIGYQTCFDNGCDPPTGAEFAAKISVGPSNEPAKVPLSFRPATYGAASGSMAEKNPTKKPNVAPSTTPDGNGLAVTGGFDPAKLKLRAEDHESRSFFAILGFAVLGGFILNFMPCVLPVIGLKVMSFVQQAGNSRSKALMLNGWYSLGLLSVFLALATLATVWNVGWGQQNQYGAFNITMIGVVFVMALSMLGVWEIPIPGFVGSGKAAELADEEGPFAAYLKGIVTTILAVPCSGPGVATALTWCTGKPPLLVYAVFASMALGMAIPYLLTGAWPSLLRFLPKPGAWMETFKELMGFVLLGTVVFMMSYLAWSNVLPTLTLMVGLWGACWWIGRQPITASRGSKLWRSGCSVLFATAIGLFAFGVPGQSEQPWDSLRDVMDRRFEMSALTYKPKPLKHQLKWEPFTVAKLQSLTAEGKTVMVDFTADWCLTCKVLESTVLNTEGVRKIVDEQQVVTLVADWTELDEEVSEMLELLGSKQIPVVAIFPANQPNEPFVFRGGYTKASLLEKLEQAGSSTPRVAGTNSSPK